MSDRSFVDYVTKDLLRDIPGITARAMFGGFGVYKDRKIFAIIVDDELYFKVGDSNRHEYESRGSKPFTYHGKSGKPVQMSYWKLPVEVMDDPEMLKKWMNASLHIEKK